MFPVGDALPVMENGQQKFVNGQALYGHNYIVVHNADKLQATLTDDLKKKLQSIGYFRNADGTTADIGNPQWSFADLSQKMSQYAAIQTGEAMLKMLFSISTTPTTIWAPTRKDTSEVERPYDGSAYRSEHAQSDSDFQPLWWHRAH